MTKQIKANQVQYVGLSYVVSLDAIVGMMILTGDQDRYSFTLEQFTNKVLNGSIQTNN